MSKSKKIIHLAPFKTNTANGAYKVIENVAYYQNKQHFVSEIWGLSKLLDNNDIEYYKHYKCNINQFVIPKNLKEDLKSEKTNIHYVQLHSVFIPINIVLSKYLNSLKIPIILMPQGGYNSFVFNRSRWKKIIFFYLFEYYHLKRVQAFNIHGSAEFNFLNKYLTNFKVLYTPNGQNIIQTKLSNKYQDNNFKLLFLGRLDLLHKGLDLLLNVLNDITFNFEFTIAGPATDSDYIKLNRILRNHRNKSKIKLINKFFNQEEKQELFKNHNLFIHTSRWEGMPTGVLEAMAYGLPALVTHNTNLTSYLSEKDGLYACDLNTKSIRNKLISLYKDFPILNIPKTLKLSEVFDWTNIVSKNTKDILKNIE